MVEATSVTAEGRITPEDSGLWKDSQIEPLRKTVEFAHSQGQKIGIQLGHAGRKASTVAPWLSAGDVAVEEVGGWPDNVLGPSEEPYSDRLPKPKAVTLQQIEEIKTAWVASVKRAIAAGFDVIEIHNGEFRTLQCSLTLANMFLKRTATSFPRLSHRLPTIGRTNTVVPSKIAFA
jgi:2,4-dienoyl-CoA reductase-like NADH-dependent reductase (Old Yellow Enzyme family)